jgi:peptide/nickel transport system substrate-binding protein
VPLLLVLLLTAVSCSKPGATTRDAGAPLSEDWLAGRLPLEGGTPRAGGSLAVRAMNEPAGLNPLDDAYRDGWVLRITRGLVLEALVGIDPVDYRLVPRLADFAESADHRVTTFTLKPGATFSDGQPLTADDVVATFAAVMATERPTGALRGELEGLAAWRKVDARTVVLEWKQPSWRALRAVADVPVLQASALAGSWATLAQRPVGTGPFVVGTWQRGQGLTLNRRDPARAHLERIVFRFVKDHTTAAALLEQGSFDLMTNVLPANWRAMEQPDPSFAWARRYHRVRSVDNSFSYIAWNQAHPALADTKVRRALAHLYDAALISKVVDLGLELPTSCPYFLGSESCGDAERPAYSLTAAKTLLAEAGFGDGDGDGLLDRAGVPLRLTFLLPANSVRLGRVVPLLQEQVRAVGGQLVVEKVETASLSARLARRDFDAVSRVWTEFDREQDLFPLFHSSQRDGGANLAGYASAEADRLLEAVRAEFDVERRRELERELHRLLVNDQPWLIMTTRQSLDLAKVQVHGLRPSLTWYDLTQVWVER